MDRILDVKIPLSLREIMVTSKDLRTEFQDLIKVKNVRAVLLGNTQDHPLIANLQWPRTEGILIKIEMETGGYPVCAIIDTGSQLDVVRADVAALSIRRAVDMTQITNMNDANGGRGQLQGWIRDVEFNCGGATTITDLWVSQKAPFELLLGRPWQRGNLVSIDERTEGTYLIFKDRATRRPRYELLAVPYDGPAAEFKSGNTSQYQSFSLLQDELLDSEEFRRMNLGSWEKEQGFIRNIALRMRERSLQKEIISQWKSVQRRDDTELTETRREALRLLRRIWVLITRIFLGFFSPQSGTSHEYEKDKREGSRNKLDQPPPLGTALAMTSSVSSISSMSLPLPATPPGEPIIQVIPKPNVPYEDVQYLLRQGYSEPPPMALPVEARESLGALEGVLTRHWAKYLNKIPIDVDLMFTIAPQCDYLGQYSLPDGQVVHRSAALNAYKILKDRRTGRYFTLAGHDITDTFQPPSSQNQTWQMEMFYPSEERLNEEMHRLAPTHLNPDPDLAFPIHATLQEPPLPSIEERLGIRSVSMLNKVMKSIHSCQNHEPLTVSPSEIFSANFQTADPHVETGFRARTNTAWPSIDEFLPSRNGSYDSVASSMPELEPASSPGDLAADLERLDQDIATRVMQGTHIIGEGEDAKFALFNKDYQEYLNKGMFSSSINTTGLSLGVCEVCFETQHDPWDTCSSGNPPSSAFTVSSEQRVIETVSDAVFSEEIPAWVRFLTWMTRFIKLY
jgi:hypothetical protein